MTFTVCTYQSFDPPTPVQAMWRNMRGFDLEETLSYIVKIKIKIIVNKYKVRDIDDDEANKLDENIDEDEIDMDGSMCGADEDGIMSSEIVNIDTVLKGSVK